MTALGSALKGMDGAQKQIASTRGWQQLQAFSRLDPRQVESAMVLAAQELRPIIIAIVLRTYATSGLQSHTKTLLKALEGARLTVTPTKIIVTLAPRVTYPNGRGNVYAAAGVFKRDKGLMVITEGDRKQLNAIWIANFARRFPKAVGTVEVRNG